MNILLLSTDLMTASQVEGAARQVGASIRVVSTADAMVSCAEETPTDLIILDLTCAASDPATLIPRLSPLDPAPKTLAFGPHVHAEKLSVARDAGCDTVLSRGQFFSQLGNILG